MQKYKKMKRAVTFLSIFLICAGVISCEPTDTKPTPKPTPVEPTPDPEPDPDPTPDPEPEPEPDGTVIYYDNLDKQITSSPVYFDQGNELWNMEGTGTDNVTYSSSYASIRSNYSSQGYPGASGGNGIYYHNESSFISVKDIELPDDERTFKLSIGLHNPGGAVIPNRNFIISISDGNKNIALNYTVEAYDKWYLATCNFSVEPAEVSHISITVQSLTAQVRSDDLRLATTSDSPSQTLDFGSGVTPPAPAIREWVEKPAPLVDKSNYKYITHFANTYRSKKYVRNYSACYDTDRHNPVWVAFPCHAIYNEGGTTRPSNDPWRPDPEMSDSEQSIIYADDWDNWPDNTARYWTFGQNNIKFVKGHLMGSADRGCGNANQLLDLNTQTFYPTNVAPEFYRTWNGGSNYSDSHWGLIERLRQDRWVCSDTLYVVIGCAYEHEDWVLYDNAMGAKRYDPSKACMVPSARYLLALRTKKGNSGKHIEDCSADEVMAIGFWFPQSFDGTFSLPALSDYIFSVSQIEGRLGEEFDFFPTAPASVKESFDISDWPGLSAIAN